MTIKSTSHTNTFFDSFQPASVQRIDPSFLRRPSAACRRYFLRAYLLVFIMPVNTTDLKQIGFTVPANGVYTLVVTDSYDNSQSGPYSLSLLRLNGVCPAATPTTLSCGAPAAGSLPRALSSSVYTYTAAAGESFSVRMLPSTGTPQPAINVYDSQGNPVGQPLSINFSGVDVTQPAARAYTVLATDASKTPAASTFTLDLLRTVNA